jgi:deoxyribodipyrimidine photo-lyase
MGSKLYFYYGKQHDVLNTLLNDYDDIEAVYINKDFTQYAIDREDKLMKVAKKHDVEFFSCNDHTLHPINTIMTGSKTFYSVFTPFYNSGIKLSVDEPIKNKSKKYVSSKVRLGEISVNKIKKLLNNETDDNIDDYISDFFNGTRKDALVRLNNIKKQKDYAKTRNNLDMNTTQLSPYIKFGLLSIREVYHKIYDLFGKKHDLIKQLYWREFYYNLSYNRLDVFDGNSFKEKYDKIKWIDNIKLFTKWKNGHTGFPIVDAGMRELNETGYMHNRARLITSNFLIKTLGIDWRKGEKYFASKLIDYDPSVNNGNWQWSSSSGADSQPYFRIFNPWKQSIDHDPDCDYIKKWVPELNNVKNNDIHNWYETHDDYDVDYPSPCIDYKESKDKILKMYKVIYK